MAEHFEHPRAFSSKVELESRHMGWVTSELPGGDHHVIKLELKGPENTLRVRQVKVLGWKEGESIKILGQISASMAQQKNCEAETLRVFRLITSQVCLTASYKFLRITWGTTGVSFQNVIVYVVVGLWETYLWRCRANSRAGGEKPSFIA